MKHAKQTRAPWILLACLAAIALCIVAAVTLLQPNTNPKNIEIPGTRGNIPATIQLPAKSARGEELPLVVLCHGFTGNRQGDGHFAPLAEDLATHGIATVRLDFAGCGDSTEPYANYTLANMAADVDRNRDVVVKAERACYSRNRTPLRRDLFRRQICGQENVNIRLRGKIAAGIGSVQNCIVDAVP